MAAAGDVVKLIAEVAVTQVLSPQRERKLNRQLDGCEAQGDPQSVA
jgi:hypothetical protein